MAQTQARREDEQIYREAVEELSWIPGFKNYVDVKDAMARASTTDDTEAAVMLTYLENRYGSLENAIRRLYPRAEKLLGEVKVSEDAKAWLLRGFRSQYRVNKIRVAFLFSVLLDTPVLNSIRSVSEKLSGMWKFRVGDVLGRAVLSARTNIYADTVKKKMLDAVHESLNGLRELYRSYTYIERFSRGDTGLVIYALDLAARAGMNPYMAFPMTVSITPADVAGAKRAWDSVARASGGKFSYSVVYESGRYVVTLRGVKEHVAEVDVSKVLADNEVKYAESIEALLVGVIKHLVAQLKDDVYLMYARISGRDGAHLVVVETLEDGIAYYTPFGADRAGWNDLGKVLRVSPELTLLFRSLAGLPEVPGPELYDTVKGRKLELGKAFVGVYETYDGRTKIAVGDNMHYKVFEAKNADRAVLELALLVRNQKEFERALEWLAERGVRASDRAVELARAAARIQPRLGAWFEYEEENEWYINGARTMALARVDSRGLKTLGEHGRAKPERLFVAIADKAEGVELDKYRASKKRIGYLVAVVGGKEVRYPIEAANVYAMLKSRKEKPEVYVAIHPVEKTPWNIVIRAGNIVFLAAPETW